MSCVINLVQYISPNVCSFCFGVASLPSVRKELSSWFSACWCRSCRLYFVSGGISVFGRQSYFGFSLIPIASYSDMHIKSLKLKRIVSNDITFCKYVRTYGVILTYASLHAEVHSKTSEHIWAPSSKFVSSSIPSWQILTAHAQSFRGARDLAFCLKVPLDSLLVWASSGGSGETARMRRLAWTFAARIGDKYQIRLTRSI